MKTSLKKPALSLALAAGLLGSAAWSPASHACSIEPILASVCAMAVPYTFGDFGPNMYALADGRRMPISQNAALYSLLGSTYGGDNVTYFNLPDLRGRVVVGAGTQGTNIYTAGQTFGQMSTNLTVAQLPTHSHTLNAATVNISQMTATTALTGLSASVTGSLKLKAVSSTGNSNDPTGNNLAATAGVNKVYTTATTPSVQMNAASIDGSGLTVGNFTGNPTTTLGGRATLAGTTDQAGLGQPVNLAQPSLVLTYYIAVSNASYPGRN